MRNKIYLKYEVVPSSVSSALKTTWHEMLKKFQMKKPFRSGLTAGRAFTKNMIILYSSLFMTRDSYLCR